MTAHNYILARFLDELVGENYNGGFNKSEPKNTFDGTALLSNRKNNFGMNELAYQYFYSENYQSIEK